jgi:dTDP-4-dehydrorhamnose reductase
VKILLLGADGQLGRRLRHTLQGQGQVVTSSRSGGDLPCDLANGNAVRSLLDSVRADVVVNASAYTQVDRAEQDAATAMRINADVPGILGDDAARRGAAVVHYSTDYVFDGRAQVPYVETDATAPLGIYGVTKLEGEYRLSSSGCDHLVLRTSWLYDRDGRNFLTTMLNLAERREEIGVVDDQIGTPTTTRYVAASTEAILQCWLSMPRDRRREVSGIYHVTAAGRTSWAGFASAIMEEAIATKRIDRSPYIRAITTAEYPTPAHRPAWSVLDTAKVRNQFGVLSQDWRGELEYELSPRSEG